MARRPPESTLFPHPGLFPFGFLKGAKHSPPVHLPPPPPPAQNPSVRAGDPQKQQGRNEGPAGGEEGGVEVERERQTRVKEREQQP